MVLHSALQRWVDDNCREKGFVPFKLAELPGYEMMYHNYCSKGSAVAKPNMFSDGGFAAETSAVHMDFCSDNYVEACELQLGSEDHLECRNLSITTYQASTVSRGDDVRPRCLEELGCRYLASVGEYILL